MIPREELAAMREGEDETLQSPHGLVALLGHLLPVLQERIL